MEPSLLEPGRSEPPVERDARRRQQGVELDLLDHRVPAAVLGRRGHELLRNRAAGADPEADERLRGAVPNALLRALDQVGVLQVVGVIGRHRIRVKDVGAGGRRERLDDPRGGLAALAAVGERRRRRVQRDDDVGREGFARSDVGGNLPAVEGIACRRRRGARSWRAARPRRREPPSRRESPAGSSRGRTAARDRRGRRSPGRRRRRRARRGGGGRPGGRAACHHARNEAGEAGLRLPRPSRMRKHSQDAFSILRGSLLRP